MIFKNIYIENFGVFNTGDFVTSQKIEEDLSPLYERLKLPVGRLFLQTGINSRLLFKRGTRPSDIATSAALNLKNLVQDFKDIDLLIYSGVCRDFLEPSTASIIHHNLGLSDSCQFFDLSNACLGFVQAMMVASSMIEAGGAKRALIVTGENAGPLVYETISKLNKDESLTRKSIKPYFANLTIGSAGVATIISKNKEEALLKLSGGVHKVDSTASSLCQGSGDISSLMMETDSPLLLQKGVNLAFKTYKSFLEEMGKKRSDFKHIITHQVGVAHRELLYQELSLDKNLDYSSFEKYGNTGSAALPLTLALALSSNIFKKGEYVSLLGIGSGLHSIMLDVEKL